MARSTTAAALPADPSPPSPPSSTFGGFVPLELIVSSPLNPRRPPPDDSLGELVASIRQHGLLEPLVVRARRPADRTGPAGGFEIVAGHRRHRAAQLAGLTGVPVMVRTVTDRELLELALAENLHRASLSPLEEARALDRLATLDPIYRDDQTLAGKIGRSATYVRNRRKLLRLSPIVLEALEADALTATHAERIARLPADIHELALAACFDRLLVDAPAPGLNDPAALIEGHEWAALAPALIGLRRFDQWAQKHAKADVTAPEVQQQLRAIVVESGGEMDYESETDGNIAAALEEATRSILQLSTDATTAEARALGVVPPSAWRLIDRPKHRCEYARKGAIVHPPPADGETVRLVDVCTERRRCSKHWPAVAAKRQAAAGAADAAAERHRADVARAKEQAERDAWAREKPAAFRAIGALLARQKLTPVEVVRRTVDARSRRDLAQRFGLGYTPQTALAFLMLARIGYNSFSRATLVASAQRYGLSARDVRAALAVAAPATATPTPAPTGKGKPRRKGRTR